MNVIINIGIIFVVLFGNVLISKIKKKVLRETFIQHTV